MTRTEVIAEIGSSVDKPTASELIDQLELGKHPEGESYHETYRSEDVIQAAALPDRF